MPFRQLKGHINHVETFRRYHAPYRQRSNEWSVAIVRPPHIVKAIVKCDNVGVGVAGFK